MHRDLERGARVAARGQQKGLGEGMRCNFSLKVQPSAAPPTPFLVAIGFCKDPSGLRELVVKAVWDHKCL